MRNATSISRRAKTLFNKFLASLLAVLMILGACPMTAMAATYTVNRTSNLDARSKTIVLDDDNYEPLFIARLRNPDIKITNSNFSTVPRGTTGATSIRIPKNKVPTNRGGSVSFDNVFTITYKNIGYTPSTSHINLKVTMTNVTLTVPQGDWWHTPTDKTTGFLIATIDDDVVSAGSMSIDNNGVNTSDQSYPYVVSQWRWEFINADTGKTLGNVQSNQVWKDLDVAHFDSKGAVSCREGITLVDGWDTNTYLSNDSKVKVSNNNATYQANKDDEREFGSTDADQYAWAMAVATKGVYTFRWTGAGCGTAIQKVADASYEPGDDPVKSADKEYIEKEDTVTYLITKKFATLPATRAAKSIAVVDEVDKALTIAGTPRVFDKDNKDVTSNWKVTVDSNANTVTYTTTKNIGGVYKFRFHAVRSDVDVFDGSYETTTEDGTKYAIIPNEASVNFVDQHGVHLTQQTNVVNVKTPEEKPATVPKISLKKIVKQSILYDPKPGDTIDYEFIVTNTGENLLKKVSISDQLKVKDMEYIWENTSDKTTGNGELAPGESVTAKAQYVLTQEDIDEGSVLNTATARGTDEEGTTVKSTDKAKTLINASASISVQKTTDSKKIVNPKAGDIVEYDVVITNNGSVTLNNIVADDDHELVSEEWDKSFDALAAGESISGKISYALTDEDIEKGNLVNTITAEGTPVNGGDNVKDTSSAETTIITTPSIGIVKTAQETIIKNAQPGNETVWLLDIYNNGHNKLKNIDVEESLPVDSIDFDWASSTDASTGEGELAIGEHVQATVKYSLTLKDVMDGKVENTATVTGVDPFGESVTSSSTAYIALPENPSASLTKAILDSDLDTTYTVEGDVISFELRGMNNGDDTLYNVSVTDDKDVFDWEEDWSNAAEEGTLQPGEYVIITCNYSLTQEDIDAQELINTAHLTGNTVRGTTVDVPANAETPLISDPGAELFKTASPEEMMNPKPGDTILYTLEGINTKAMTLYNTTITDQKSGIYGFHYLSDVNELAPGDRIVAQCQYDITQEDIDRGFVDNTAVLNATTRDGRTVIAEAKATTILHRDATLICTKDTIVRTMEGAQEGDSIPYTFSVANDKSAGNTTITDIEIRDVVNGEQELADVVFDWSTASKKGQLAPGEIIYGTGNYKLTQADIDRGYVDNAILVDGKTTISEKPELHDEDTVHTDIIPVIDPSVVKDVDKINVENAKAGDKLQYTFTGINKGNVTISAEFVDNVNSRDGEELAATFDWGSVKEAGKLAPGETVSGTAVLVLTQEDIDRGYVENTITMTGKTPSGDPYDPQKSTVYTNIEQNPDVEILKEVDKDIIDPAHVGDAVNYTVTVTNTGNVTLKDVKLTDELVDAYNGFTYEWDGEEGTLLPGEKVVAKAEYKIAQEDIDKGSVENTALVETDKTEPETSTVITELKGTPSIKLTKAFDVNGKLTGAKAGDEVPVLITLENDGEVKLKVNDIKESLPTSQIVIDWRNSSDDTTEDGILAVGETVTATCTYKVTQDDIDKMGVDNKATVHAETVTPDKTPVEAEGEDTLEIEQFSKLGIKKTADTTSLKDPTVGTPIAYSITITNEGNTTLTKTFIDDKLKGVSALTYQWDGEEGVLMPGASVTATCVYKLTADDIKEGQVTNVAIATGKNPNGETVTSEEVSVTTTISTTPEPEKKTSTPTTTTPASTTTAQAPTNVKTGDVLPIVGGIAAVAILAAALLFFYRKRRA